MYNVTFYNLRNDIFVVVVVACCLSFLPSHVLFPVVLLHVTDGKSRILGGFHNVSRVTLCKQQ